MSTLKHVSTAIHHGEVLVGEAEDLREFNTAALLAEGVSRLTRALNKAFNAAEEISDAKQTKRMARRSLKGLYDCATSELEGLLPNDVLYRVTPASHLDVAERTRYRLRRLARIESSAVAMIRVRLQSALSAYDIAIDCYLTVCTQARSEKERAIIMSQRFRLDLERAKTFLLTVAEQDSDAFARIKSRVVRTKKARWLSPVDKLSDDFTFEEVTN